MSELKNIPKHWKINKLEDFLDYIQPTSYIVESTEYSDSYDTPVLTAGKTFILGKTNEKKGVYDSLPVIIFDDFTTASRLVNFPFKVKSSAMKILKPANEEVVLRFWYYYMQTVRISTDTHKRYWISVFSKQQVHVPPVSEQLIIVSKIEELLSDLENGKQQLLAAQQQLKVYRQSLLKAAFEGRLTKSLGNWSKNKLGDIAYAIDPQPSHRTPPISADGIPYVSIKDFDSKADKINLINARKVSSEILKEHRERYKLEIGDFVIGKIGTIGKPVRVILPQNYTLSANIVLIQPRKVNSTYLYYFFQSDIVEKEFTAGMNATTQAAFGIQKVRELTIYLPTTEEEQQLIVNELESKLTVCDKIEENINQSLKQADTLKQSILKKAFEGKLVSFEETTEVKSELPHLHLQFPKTVDAISTTDLHAGIISMVITAHEKNPHYLSRLNHVKCEKIAHIVEAKIGLSLGREPVKDAAGPDDYHHLTKVEHRANMANWFGSKKLDIGRTYYSKPGMNKIIEKVQNSIPSEDLKKIDGLISTFLPFELEHAELIATIYAGWNNLLLEGLIPTDEQIVYESRENWSKRKLTISRENFFKTLEWMKNHGYIPEGRGKKVRKNEKLETSKKNSK